MVEAIAAMYALISVIILFNSYREGEETGGHWDIMRVIGLLACLVWPILLIAVVLAARRAQRNIQPYVVVHEPIDLRYSGSGRTCNDDRHGY